MLPRARRNWRKLETVLPDCVNISTVDGVRVTLKEGLILVRSSGTEPAIRFTVKGESLKAARKIMERGKITVTRIVEDAIR